MIKKGSNVYFGLIILWLMIFIVFIFQLEKLPNYNADIYNYCTGNALDIVAEENFSLKYDGTDYEYTSFIPEDVLLFKFKILGLSLSLVSLGYIIGRSDGND